MIRGEEREVRSVDGKKMENHCFVLSFFGLWSPNTPGYLWHLYAILYN